MIEAVNLGSFLVPTWPAAVVVALCIAVLATDRVAARVGLDRRWLRGVAEGAAWTGVLGARLGYVAADWSAYRLEPWTALYLWQPGYSAYAGVVAGAVYALWRIARRAESSRWRCLGALFTGYAGGALALSALIAALHVFAPPTLVGRGERVPDVVLVDLDGNRVQPSDLAGRGIVLNFWATWCPPCRREMPLLDAIHAEFSPLGLTVVGVAVGESRDAVAPFVEQLGLRYPIWSDAAASGSTRIGTRAFHDRFAGAGLPTTVFVDRDGIVRNVYVGELNRAYLREQIERILSP